MQQATTVQPAPRTAASLRAEIKAAQANLGALNAQRADMAGRLAVTNRPGERARLNGDLRRTDAEIAQTQEQIAGLNAQLRLVEARTGGEAAARTLAPPPAIPVTRVAPVNPPFRPVVGVPTPPPPNGLDENAMILGGVITVFVLAPLALAIAWRLIRRQVTPVNRAELAESAERLRRMEQAIDTIAVEVERISENQRYLTNAIAAESKSRERV